MSKTIKRETNNDKISLPSRIIKAGKVITSAKRKAIEYTDFYIKKIEQTRRKFIPSDLNPNQDTD